MTYKENKQTLKEEDLKRFTGSMQVFKSGYWPFIYTEGVRYVAQVGEAYWLLDLIASYQIHSKVKESRPLQDIQFWTLTKSEDESAVVKCEIDQGIVAVDQKIEYTDFPLDSIKLYLCHMHLYWSCKGRVERKNEHYGTLLLPSEY